MSWLFGNPVNKILSTIMSWFSGLIVDSFTYVFKAVKNILVSTPDVTTLPQVQALTGTTTTILDVVFVLAFLAVGVLTIVAGGDEKARYTAKQLMPRLIVAFIAAHFSPLFCSMLINLADAVASSLASGNPSHLSAFSAVSDELQSASSNTPPLLFAILAAIITFLFATVSFTFLTRIGVLILIAITGPLALACHALPQTEGVAKLWWRSLLGCLAIPLLQVLALESGETIMLDPHTMGFLFGLPGLGIISLFITIVLLWITVKIPGMVRKSVMKNTSQGFAMQVVKVLVIQRGVRALTGRR